MSLIEAPSPVVIDCIPTSRGAAGPSQSGSPTPADVIRVAIADDQPVIRAGIAQLLEAEVDIEVVGTATDGLEAVRLAETVEPDVVLMDLDMPRLDGVAATRSISLSCPATRVIALTSSTDPARILATLAAGAVGYLLKDFTSLRLLEAVRAAMGDLAPLDPVAAKALLAAWRRVPSGRVLTARERQVLTLLASGRSNRQMAEQLGISEATVKAHLTKTFQSIGVTDRTQAAVWAFQHGMTSTTELA